MNSFYKYYQIYFDNKIKNLEFQLEQVRNHIPRSTYDELDCLNELDLVSKIRIYKEIQADLFQFFQFIQ